MKNLNPKVHHPHEEMKSPKLEGMQVFISPNNPCIPPLFEEKMPNFGVMWKKKPNVGVIIREEKWV